MAPDERSLRPKHRELYGARLQRRAVSGRHALARPIPVGFEIQ
jgi:hypothetical protein